MARALLLRACPDDPAGLSIVGDLDEEYAQRCARHGQAKARRWYWRSATGVWWHAAWRHPANSHHQPRRGADGSTWPVTFVTRADFFAPFPARRC